MARRGRQDVKHKQSASPSRQLLVKGVGLHTAAPKPEREVWVRWRASVGSHLETRRKSTEQRAYPVLEFGSVLVVIYLWRISSDSTNHGTNIRNKIVSVNLAVCKHFLLAGMDETHWTMMAVGAAGVQRGASEVGVGARFTHCPQLPTTKSQSK